jgi:hypothetical protein
MRMIGLGKAAVVAAGFLLSPTAALADESWPGYYFNDGNGNCGYVQCGPNGCAILDEYPCPREVDPNG